MTKRIRRQPMLATNTNGSIRSRSSQLPRFPLEISETVIDACAQFPNAERDVKDVYSCLCASALTCRAWYPRARLQLYDHVKITGSIQFEKLLRTLLASPSHGDFVHRLSIAVDPMGPGRFLSAGVVFVALCSKLRMLDRIDIIYTPVRPHVSFFVSLRAAQYRTVTILSLSGYSFSSIKDLIKYITSFPELRRLKVVQDDYDPPQPSQLRQALYVVNLPRLTTLQTELRHATNGPCSSTHIATHLIDWLTKSPTARHLRQIWIIYTVELSDEDHGAATRIDSLLKASGDSLQELVLAVQITSEVKEIWKVNLFKGLKLTHNPNLKRLYLFQIPWRTLSRALPSIISSSNTPHLETVVLTFYPEEKWPEGTLTRHTLHEYDVLTEVDTSLFNNFPAFRELIIDHNGTADEDSQRKLLACFPQLRARNLVHLESVDENRVRIEWGLP